MSRVVAASPDVLAAIPRGLRASLVSLRQVRRTCVIPSGEARLPWSPRCEPRCACRDVRGIPGFPSGLASSPGGLAATAREPMVAPADRAPDRHLRSAAGLRHPRGLGAGKTSFLHQLHRYRGLCPALQQRWSRHRCHGIQGQRLLPVRRAMETFGKAWRVGRSPACLVSLGGLLGLFLAGAAEAQSSCGTTSLGTYWWMASGQATERHRGPTPTSITCTS